MASRFQSRLVGTIVLVAVGVIILPDLLDGKNFTTKKSLPVFHLSLKSALKSKALRC